MLDNKYTILYVDDEEANLRVFKSAFKWEYHVLIANSGMEGLEVLEHNDVQLVITDQRMPEMTGVEFLEKVVEKYPDVIRVILTGYSDMEAIVDAINKGKIYYYIRKPWNEEDVKITIDKALEAYGLKKENKNLIESLKNKNEELQHSNQELDLFIYRASHDLKGPVATFLGLIELARRGNVDNNVLGGLEDTARKMDKMLIKLRMVNSINSSELEYTEINLNDMMQNIINSFNGLVTAPDTKVNIPNLEGIEIKSDLALMEIILRNVIENALLYRNAYGDHNVDIKINEDDNRLDITITDNGMGIREESLDKIFNMFYRGTENSKGNGLGLYLVKRAVEKLHGILRVDSSYGQGSTFQIVLPMRKS